MARAQAPAVGGEELPSDLAAGLGKEEGVAGLQQTSSAASPAHSNTKKKDDDRNDDDEREEQNGGGLVITEPLRQMELVEDREQENEKEEEEEQPRSGNQYLNPLQPRDKHFFILSNAGKPIFTYHGDEQQLSPLMGMFQAMISLSIEQSSSSDCIRSITTGRQKFVFLLREELYLLAVTTTREPEPYLKLQLEYLYQQVMFMHLLRFVCALPACMLINSAKETRLQARNTRTHRYIPT